MPKLSGDSKPAALVLSPEAPYPVIGGGPLRTASLLTWLARRYSVDLVVFREPGAPDPRDSVPPGVFREIQVIDLPYHSKHPIARAGRNFRRYLRGTPPLIDRFSNFEDVVRAAITGRTYNLGVIEHFWCARYVDVLREVSGRVLLNLHNIESVLLARTAEPESWATAAILRRFSEASRRLEHRLLRQFDTLLVPSEHDKIYALEAAPSVKTVVYPNAIPVTPMPAVGKLDEIVFSGNLEYQPNISAVRFFAGRIWPVLRSRWPNLRWRLVGRNHEPLRNRLAGDSRIVFTGPVDDAIASMATARAAVVPLLAGSGTRVKIIEAWAAALPVVSTAIGAEGLPGVRGEHILIADQPGDFVNSVSSLLASPGLQKIVGDNGRHLYETELTWESAWKRLEEADL